MQTIKTISLLLSERHGKKTDYHLSLSVYAANVTTGATTGSALGTVVRDVADIDHEGWYSFAFGTPLSLSAGYYAFTLHHTYESGSEGDAKNNFVEWIHSEDLSTTKTLFSISAGTDNNKVMRCFKIYEDFNDISLVSSGIQINTPAATIKTLTLNNRQDFVLDADQEGIEVTDNRISLSDSGNKISFADISKDNQPEWLNANFGLPNNDINGAHTENPLGNLNEFKTWMVTSPYFSGISFSTNSGFSWTNSYFMNIDGSLETITRNFSCVKLSPDCMYALAFDDTSDSERGKVFYADLTTAGVPDETKITNLQWISAGRIEDGNGIKTNEALFLDSHTVWAGTERGVFVCDLLVHPYAWVSKNTGLPSSSKINDIKASYSDLFVYGYGYGYASGSDVLDYFNVFNLPGYKDGYGYGNFETTNVGEFSYGYGYERTFGEGNLQKVYVAAESGVYIYSGTVWVKIGGSIWDTNEPLCLHIVNDKMYVGINGGIFRSIYNSGFNDFYGLNATDAFYPFGLSGNQTTSVLSNVLNDSEIIVSQFGGVFVSKNEGGNFSIYSGKLKDKNIKKLLSNPLNNYSLYAITESVRFTNSAISFLIDSSGSMVANDPDNKRLDSAKKIIDQIQASSGFNNYYQVSLFGLPENDVNHEAGYISAAKDNSLIDFPGAKLLTGNSLSLGTTIASSGFISDVVTAKSYIDDCVNQDHRRTPLIDAISVFANGMNSDGAYWKYNYTEKEYNADNLTSDYFYDLSKAVVIFTDGNDSVRGTFGDLDKEIEDSASATYDAVKKTTLSKMVNYFEAMRCSVYIVGVGNNINYNNLKAIKDLHPYSYLYLAPFEENIFRNSYGYGYADIGSTVNYLDVAETILLREKSFSREGTWTKLIDLSKKQIVKSCDITANLPPNTDGNFRARVSFDKDLWSGWTSPLAFNLSHDINLFGRYIEIEVNLSSELTYYSPEVISISFGLLEPSESYLFYNNQTSLKPIREIYYASRDSFTLGEAVDAELEAGFTGTDSIDWNRYKNLNYNKRSFVGRKTNEYIISTDGYFYHTENGAWHDTDIVIYDGDIQVNPKEYYAIPSEGVVFFYSRQIDSGNIKKFLIAISDNNDYRIGLKVTNYKDAQALHFDEAAWTYYSLENSQVAREVLPYAPSQLKGTNYGFVNHENYPVSRGLSAVYRFQYIVQADLSNSALSFSTGQRINLKNIGEDNFKTYSQNTFIEKFNVNNTNNYAYVQAYENNVLLNNSNLSMGLVYPNSIENPSLEYQVNLSISSAHAGDSINFVMGAEKGYPVWLRQDNLIFSNSNFTYGEFETSFIFNGNQPLEPKIKMCGTNASKLVVICPTKLNPSQIFSFSVLAVDGNGFIDRNFVGTVELSSDNFVTLNRSEIQFVFADAGVKKVNGFVNADSTGVGRISANFKDSIIIFKSNPIYVADTDIMIKWGDLNVSTVFSDGRQNIDFVCNYAKNISNLDFVGFADDLSVWENGNLDYNKEWEYLVYRSEKNSNNGFFAYPGFKYRVFDSYGERAVILGETSNLPAILPDSPLVQGNNSDSQISSLIGYLGNYLFVSMPVHSAYVDFSKVTDTSKQTLVYKDRGFDFENYRKMVGHSAAFSDFVNSESAIEIYSEHGFCETESDSESNTDYFSVDQNRYIDHALLIGKKFCFTASSGGYSSRPGYYAGDISPRINLPVTTFGNDKTSNRGLTAVVLDSFTRQSVIDGINNRTCYATTGARIYADFHGTYNANNVSMGDTQYLSASDMTADKPNSALSLYFNVVSDKSPIRNIQIIRILVDDIVETVDSVNLSGSGLYTYELNWTDNSGERAIGNIEVKNKEICYCIRMEQMDGHCVWVSPVWFNFGRTNGIASVSDNSSEAIKKPVFSSAQLGQIDFVGNFSGSSDQTLPIAQFDLLNPLPTDYFLLSINNAVPNPSTRKAYSNAYLEVADLTLNSGGMRVYATNNENIIYGTYYLKFIAGTNDESLYYTKSSGGANDAIYLPTGTSYKKLTDWTSYVNSGTYTWVDSYVNTRSKLFGYMLSYSNNSTVKAKYSFNDVSVFKPSGMIQVVRDPYLVNVSNIWYMTYVSYNSNAYPEQKNVTYTGKDADFVDSYGITEDFAGLLDIGIENDVHRIALAQSTDNTLSFSAQSFLFDNTFNGSTLETIVYPSSPNLIQESDHYNMYYMGWFSENNKFYPCLFVHQFQHLYLTDGAVTPTGYNFDTKSTNVGFVFSNESLNFNFYANRKCTTSSDDMIWNYYRQDQIASFVKTPADWQSIHPAYGLGFSWVSVVKNDDGVYYAFFNKNMVRDNLGSIIGNEGIGILYSFDGINFFEYDYSGTIKENDIVGKIYPHVFKVNGQWYLAYTDTVDRTWLNGTRKTKYIAFNWQVFENFSPAK